MKGMQYNGIGYATTVDLFCHQAALYYFKDEYLLL